MNTDPDFHPLTAAWLDGTATPSEQQLLGEILHSPDMVREYAALCRMETMLAQCGTVAVERRAALGRMLDGKPWPCRVAGLWKHHAVRWAAAAALILLCAWWFWPYATDEQPDMAKHRRLPRTEARPAFVPAAPDEMRVVETPPPPDAGLETKLRQWYTDDFAATGPLPEAVAKFVADIGSDIRVTADVHDAGDAPVFIIPPTALPAWTLLQMMAVQSGTEVRLSGRNIVFRAAKKPVPRDGHLVRTCELGALRGLFALSLTAPDKEVFPKLTPASSEMLGGRLGFTLAPEKPITYSGPSRDVRVLELALSSITSPPVNVAITVKLVHLSPGVFQVAGDRPQLTGVFTDPQFQVVMRSLSEKSGVDLLTMPDLVTAPHRPANVSTVEPGKEEGFTGTFTAAPAGGQECRLECDLNWSLADPPGSDNIATQQAHTTLRLYAGQTACVSTMIKEDGSEAAAFISATLVDAAGQPILSEAPAEAPDTTPPAPAVHMPAVREELPYGIPVVDKPGMVQSPYAAEKGFIDVDGLKRGTRVECPYTGKHFRVP